MGNDTKRIIIINWKWRFLNDYKINDRYLEKYDLSEFLLNFYAQKKKQSLYVSFPVGSPQTMDKNNVEKVIGAQEASPLFDIEAYARVICCNIYNDINSRRILDKLIELVYHKYSKERKKIEIMLFLHRGHSYTYKDVLQFLESTYIKNCFLFEAGHDFIYYHTEKKGLIDHIGRFYKGWENEGDSEKYVRTHYIEGGEKIIDLAYFNNVWGYYSQEFKQKVKNLFVAFIRVLLGFEGIKKKEGFEKKSLIGYFEEANKTPQNELIYYRIKSFLGLYDNITLKIDANTKEPTNQEEYDQLKEEREIIGKFEKKRKQSYTFDDVRANLEHQHENDEKDKGTHKLYKELNKLMCPLFLPKKAYNKKINPQQIRDIRDLMDELIEIIPGNHL